MGGGTGTFIKLDRSFLITSSHIFSFGETHMIIQIDIESQDI